MAKSNKNKKIETISNSFSLDNLKKAKEEFSKKEKEEESIDKEKKRDDYVITLKILKEHQDEFSKLYYNFQYESEVSMTGIYEFFRIILLEIVEKNQLSIKDLDDKILKMVKRVGRRRTDIGNFRNTEDKELSTVCFGSYNDDTDQLFDIAICFFAKKQMQYMESFSRRFFFYDIVEFTRENIDEIITKYKNK